MTTATAAAVAITEPGSIRVRALDPTGQRRVEGELKEHWTVGEMIQSLLSKMRLVRNDSNGRPLSYRARLTREGRHLLGSELVGEALRTGDEISLHPSVDAGVCGGPKSDIGIAR